MKHFRPGAALALLASFAAMPLSAQSTYDQVDPMIGTGGEGHTFPGGSRTFWHGAILARYRHNLRHPGML